MKAYTNQELEMAETLTDQHSHDWPRYGELIKVENNKQPLDSHPSQEEENKPSSSSSSPAKYLMPVLFLHRGFISLCSLTYLQWKLYLSSLEPSIPDLSVHLDAMLEEFSAFSSTLAQPPVFLYHKFALKRKMSTLPTEDLLAKMNGFTLATIFFLFHQKQQPSSFSSSSSSVHPSSSCSSTDQQQELLLFAEKKRLFQETHHDLLQSYPELNELDFYYLVNFEYVITWLYQNIFSVGKQVNQEYLMIAGMTLEGSHRILARGGGSGNYRKLREELYRIKTGKAKQKRAKKEVVGGASDVVVVPLQRVMSREEEEAAFKESPVVNDQKEGDEEMMVEEDRREMSIPNKPHPLLRGKTGEILACQHVIPPIPDSGSTVVVGQKRKHHIVESEVEEEEGEGDAASCSSSERSTGSGNSEVSPTHWKKKIKLNQDHLWQKDSSSRSI